jgi:hypothetical protein
MQREALYHINKVPNCPVGVGVAYVSKRFRARGIVID